jgi:hypothetical protein
MGNEATDANEANYKPVPHKSLPGPGSFTAEGRWRSGGQVEARWRPGGVPGARWRLGGGQVEIRWRSGQSVSNPRGVTIGEQKSARKTLQVS